MGRQRTAAEAVDGRTFSGNGHEKVRADSNECSGCAEICSAGLRAKCPESISVKWLRAFAGERVGGVGASRLWSRFVGVVPDSTGGGDDQALPTVHPFEVVSVFWVASGIRGDFPVGTTSSSFR